MSLVYLLGHPVAHSLSPAMHNAAFRHLGLPHAYETLDVTAAELPAAVARIRDGDVLGANVTVPHKEAVMRLVDTWDGPTAEIGAANTLARTPDGKQLLAANTDVVGFQYATREVDLADRRVLVLGSGGAARAVIAVLHRRGAHVTLANRTLSRAEILARSVAHPAALGLTVIDWARRVELAEVDVIVNTTSLGLRGEDPLAGATLRRELVVIDLVPTAVPTPLVKRARETGATVVDGLPMLLQQAASSFQIWTRREAPVEAMRAALYARVC